MIITPKNHTISKFVAKLFVRVLVLMLLFAFIPFLMEDKTAGSLEHIYFYIPNKWALVFPALLFLTFITLLILCLRFRFSKTDLNWMVSLNAGLLIVYLIMLYARLYPLIFG